MFDHQGGIKIQYIPFTWSESSRNQNKKEYDTVITALKASIHSPNVEPHDRSVVIKLLKSPAMNPFHWPRTCWMTDAEWYSVSRALRDWQREPGTQPIAYAYAIRAKGAEPSSQ